MPGDTRVSVVLVALPALSLHEAGIDHTHEAIQVRVVDLIVNSHTVMNSVKIYSVGSAVAATVCLEPSYEAETIGEHGSIAVVSGVS